MTPHTIGTAEQHLAARLKLLEAEKDLTHRSDRAPNGRDEDGLPYRIAWLRRRGECETAA